MHWIYMLLLVVGIFILAKIIANKLPALVTA